MLTFCGGVRGVMVQYVANGQKDPSSNLDEEGVCILHKANNHGNGMNRFILPSGWGK